MNINLLFSIISLSLLAIFFLFKPMDLKQKTFVDIPLFELNQFTLNEIDTLGLRTSINGLNAIHYVNRYTVEKIDYTDNSKEYIANMQANHGEYKNQTVDLVGDIVYSREDGLRFTTQELTYNKNTHIALTKTPYVAYRGESVAKGSSLKYNNVLDTLESKNIEIKYKLGDKIQ